jgi:hypothetical protein
MSAPGGRGNALAPLTLKDVKIRVESAPLIRIWSASLLEKLMRSEDLYNTPKSIRPIQELHHKADLKVCTTFTVPFR